MRIDPTPQGDGIEAGIGLARGFLVCFGDVGRQKHTLIWRLGRIIRLPHLFVNSVFVHEFEGRLEEVDAETKVLVESVEVR